MGLRDIARAALAAEANKAGSGRPDPVPAARSSALSHGTVPRECPMGQSPEVAAIGPGGTHGTLGTRGTIGTKETGGTLPRPSVDAGQVSSESRFRSMGFPSLRDEERYEERAAILEYEAGWPRRWAEYFARQIVKGPPGDFSPVRWQQALDGALIFADEWATKAIAAGWEPEDVFGIHPVAPAARVDQRGLAWLLGDGSRVVALDAKGADIRTPRGGRQRYYRATCRGMPDTSTTELVRVP